MPTSTIRTGRGTAAAAEAESAERCYEVAVIGTGFSGIGVAVGLLDAGLRDFVVLEKAADVGGTWRENTYPGCACDVPSSLYSYSYALNPAWDRVFAGQPQIQEYIKEVAAGKGVTPYIRFGTEVTSASWNDDEQRWEIETSQGRVLARVLASGAGPLHEPRIPAIPGIERFQGKIFHSARWDHGHDLRGRRVAVVGTGASAVQFVPEIQPKVERLYLYQRTAPWVLPKLDRRVGRREQELFRRLPAVQALWRKTLYGGLELLQMAQRHPRVMRAMQRLAIRHLRRSVTDPQLRRRLMPSFVLGCKRLLMSNDWYPAVTASNVEVLSTGVAELREHSVIGTDGSEREVDTVIFGTGFHVTDPPISTCVRGRDGRTLAETWNGSPQAYIGTTVSGFPNLFLLVGPNMGNGHTSIIVVIEAQVRYLVDAVRTMRRDGITSFDVRPEVQREWNAGVQDALKGTVWNAGGCSSYYLDVNGRNSSIYPWTTIDLRRRLAHFDVAAYRAARRAAEVAA